MKNEKCLFDEKFTNRYSLAKTLRFELKPIGKTLDNMRMHLKYDENLQTFLIDQEIEDAYQILKPVFDKLHEKFITKSLENEKNKSLFNFENYLELRKKLASINKKEKEAEYKKIEDVFTKEETKLRKMFDDVWKNEGESFKNEVGVNEKGKAILKENGFKVLTEAGIIKYIKSNIKKFAELGLKTRKEISWKKTNKNLVEKTDLEKALGTADNKGIFEGFFTYLSGFNQNRENYYDNLVNKSGEGKSTAVSNRIIAENLPKFCDNVLEFEKRKDEILRVDEFLKEKNIALIAKDQNGKEIELHKIEAEFFEIGHFVNCLSQSEIEKYNLEIGNANNLINRYNQQKSNEIGYKKIAKLKVLYKQIGCGEKKEFIATIKDENELKEIFGKISSQGDIFFRNTKKLTDAISSLENYSGVYWSDKALNTISAKYFKNWDNLKELLKVAKVFKKDKDEIKIPQVIELSDLFAVLDDNTVEFKENFKDNNNKKQEIVKKSDLKNSQKLLRMIFTDIDANKEIFEIERDNVLKISKPKEDTETQKIKNWLDSLLFSNQILKYFKVRENKIKGNQLNSEISEPLNDILFKENPTENYDIIRNFLTKKPTAEINKLKLNFENSSLAAGWDRNKEADNSCIILKDKDNKRYLAVMKHGNTKLFEGKAKKNELYDVDNFGWQKMIYKLIPGASKTLPKVLFSDKWTKINPIPENIGTIYQSGNFKKGDNFNLNALHKLIDFYKEQLEKYPTENNWQDLFEFNFSDTEKYESIDQFYNEVDKQGYKIDFISVNKLKIDKLVEKGDVYLFEICNKDNNLRDGKEKPKEGQNLHSIYWNAVFGKFKNKPKLNGEAEIFYRSAVKDLEKKKDKSGKEVIAHKRFGQEKFIFHCPLTLNFCLKSSKLNDEINKTIIRNSDNVCFIGIDRGEKHLAYYSLINVKGDILEQGSFNEINKQNYAMKLEERAGNRDEARKNWKTIGTIKELKDGYISQVVRKIVDLAIYKDVDKKILREAPVYIILENLNIGFKRGRQKIEKSVYQKLELALAKKLNFVVDKKAKDGDVMSVEKALQLTPPVQNFQDIGNQCGIMLYVRANYTSQTDPVTGWRKTIYLSKTMNEDLKAEIFNKFNEIGFDGKDYYFVYEVKYEKEKGNIKKGRSWILWSGKNGKSLDRFRGKKNMAGIWEVEKQDIVKLLDEVFGEQKEKTQKLKDKITNENARTLKFAIDLIQQIRNTGIDKKDIDFILSPVRDKNGKHFDSRENEKIPNGDANGAYNIARKGLMTFEKIKNGEKELYIYDADWDEWLANQNK